MKNTPRFSVVVFVLVVMVAMVGCSGGGAGSGSGGNATLTVGSRSTFGGKTFATKDVSSKSLDSGGGQIDGIRLWIKNISVMEANNGPSYGVWSSPEAGGTVIDLRSDGDLKTLSEQISIPNGEYERIILQFYDHFALKAKATEGRTLYYTTPGGIVSGGGSEPGSDYGFYEYPFVYITTGDPDEMSLVDQEDIVSPVPFVVEDGSTYEFDILVDLVHLAYFWNGDENGTKIPPFTWHPNGEDPVSDYFPNGEANFGIQYIPLAFSIGEADNSSYEPMIETYVVAPSGTDISADPHSLEYGTVTFAFMNSGVTIPFWGRTRNFDMVSFEQFYSDFSDNGNNTFSCRNHAHNDSGGINITSFPRLSVGESGVITSGSGDFAVYRLK